MDIGIIKSNLRKFYDREATLRNEREKQAWKIRERSAFARLLQGENKRTLLELGAGTGHDSRFFMEQGFTVTAVDLSAEMVRLCREKGIDAHVLDFYDLASLGKTFDACWSMNSLLHVPKTDITRVLKGIKNALNNGALFYFGVYGGEDDELEWANDVSEVPRFFSRFTSSSIQEVMGGIYNIVSFEQFELPEGDAFQAAVLRK
jgi:SAM-dependent methyltransferase